MSGLGKFIPVRQMSSAGESRPDFFLNSAGANLFFARETQVVSVACGVSLSLRVT